MRPEHVERLIHLRDKVFPALLKQVKSGETTDAAILNCFSHCLLGCAARTRTLQQDGWWIISSAGIAPRWRRSRSEIFIGLHAARRYYGLGGKDSHALFGTQRDGLPTIQARYDMVCRMVARELEQNPVQTSVCLGSKDGEHCQCWRDGGVCCHCFDDTPSEE